MFILCVRPTLPTEVWIGFLHTEFSVDCPHLYVPCDNVSGVPQGAVPKTSRNNKVCVTTDTEYAAKVVHPIYTANGLIAMN